MKLLRSKAFWKGFEQGADLGCVVVILVAVLYFGYQFGHAIVFSPALREVLK